MSGHRQTSKPRSGPLELADIFRKHARSFLSTHPVAARHIKVMQQIVNCRTEVLGGHRYHCARCGYQRYVYHSCRNRHCPKCQTSAKEAWREARQLELLPVPYFHNVFTLPHELNGLILCSESNQRQLLKLLFDSAARTLLEFGRRELGGQVGFTLVLHTWDQQLRPHFHVHCLVASGALSKDKQRWIAGGSRFLFPVRALSKVYRGKFVDGLQKLLGDGMLKLPSQLQSFEKQRQLIRKLSRKSWVVYSKPPFAGPAKLLDYLSRYTHRVAITNSRLKQCTDRSVTFTYRDRRDGDRKKLLELSVQQFIQRFLTHVLPDRFMRIRHYGFMANRNRKRNIATIRKLIGARTPVANDSISPIKQWLQETFGSNSSNCPCCGDKLIETEIPDRLTDSAYRSRSIGPQQLRKRGPP